MLCYQTDEYNKNFRNYISPFPLDFSEMGELLLIPDSYGPIIENQPIISVR